MQTYSLPIRLMDDFTTLPSHAIALELTQVEQARHISQGFPSRQRWQAYLAGLAYLGFTEWLQMNVPDLPMQVEQATVLCAGEVTEPVITNLAVGAFRVCLIAIATDTETTFYLPAAVITAPASLAHFYVVVQVQEELSQVWVQHFLRYDELRDRQHAHPLVPVAEGYELPATWFNPRSDQLLLDLQCLDVAAMPLPSQPLAAPDPLTALINRLQPVINLGNVWFQGALDQLVEQWGWLLLPPLVPGLRSLLRSPLEELDTLLVELHRRGTDILPMSQAVYHDISLESHPLRLYAVFAPSTTTPSEWKLLVILGAQPHASLPVGIRLQVSDGTTVLVEQTLTQATDLSYLFGLVVGTWAEQFWVTLCLNDTVLTLPPLAFQVELNPRSLN